MAKHGLKLEIPSCVNMAIIFSVAISDLFVVTSDLWPLHILIHHSSPASFPLMPVHSIISVLPILVSKILRKLVLLLPINGQRIKIWLYEQCFWKECAKVTAPTKLHQKREQSSHWMSLGYIITGSSTQGI